MQKTLRVIHVFLASPSDVAKERETGRQVIEQINRSAAKELGVHLELFRWEDIGPGFGRPQTLINEFVDRCDLFIGILWERWGQSTGGFSSGFYEEFERAKARRAQSGTPDIWLFFKKLRNDKLADPGEQLKEVISFRDHQRKLNELLYFEFRAPKWRDILLERLLSYLINFAQNALPLQEEEAPANSPLAASMQMKDPADPDATPRSIQTSIANVSVASQSFSMGISEIDGAAPTPLDLVRTYIFLHSLLSRRVSGSVFETHEINLAYKLRHKLDLSVLERTELLRTTIADKGNVAPGWFWSTVEMSHSPLDALLNFSRNDRAELVRTRSLDLLRHLGRGLPEYLWLELPVQDDSHSVRAAAFNVIEAQESERALTFLNGMTLFDSAAADDLSNSRFALECVVNPTKALKKFLCDGTYVGKKKLDLINRSRHKINNEVLREGLQASDSSLRLICLTELLGRDLLDEQEMRGLLSDPSYSVRALVLEKLAMLNLLPETKTIREAMKRNDDSSQSLYPNLARILGDVADIPTPDVEDIVLTFFRAKGTKEIFPAIEWFSVDGSIAYQVLCEKNYPPVVKNVRSDLETGFSRIKEETFDKIVREQGEQRAATYREAFGNYDALIRTEFENAALTWLATCPLPGDEKIARRFVHRDFSPAQLASIRILSAVGTTADRDEMMELVRKVDGSAKPIAASAALSLSESPVDTAEELFESDNSDVSTVAFQWLRTHISERALLFFRNVLARDDEKARLRGVLVLAEQLPPDQFERLLDEQLETEHYYYNVVTWMDRLIYAPPVLRDAYLATLRAETLR